MQRNSCFMSIVHSEGLSEEKDPNFGCLVLFLFLKLLLKKCVLFIRTIQS